MRKYYSGHYGIYSCHEGCPAPYFSDPTSDPYICQINCPDHYYGDEGDPLRYCKPCDAKCDLCFGGDNTKCTKCK